MDHSVFLDHPRSKSKLCVPYQSDARLLLTWVNSPPIRDNMLRFGPVMLEGEQKWLADLATNSARFGSFSATMLMVVAKDTNKRIGTIGMHNIDWKNRHATTGTMIGSTKHQGKGYGTDAKMLLLDWAFNELGLHKVLSYVIESNARSLAYGRRCGYEEVGRYKEHVWSHGTWKDLVALEVHAQQWQPLWKKFEDGTFRT